MKGFFTTKRACRAGLICALYTALTYAFGALSFAGIQVRPSEALTLLPLFYPEAVFALFLGCILSNFASPFFLYDVTFGSLATLLSALCTYFMGKLIRKSAGRIALGGLFPVLVNAFVLPVIIALLSTQTDTAQAVAYWTTFGTIFVGQVLWVYGLGIPIYLFVERMRKRNVSAFLD